MAAESGLGVYKKLADEKLMAKAKKALRISRHKQ